MALTGLRADARPNPASALHDPFQFRRSGTRWKLPAFLGLLLGFAAGADMRPAHARDVLATPGSYAALLRQLRPGDRLILAPGAYTRGLRLHGLNGTPAAPIFILGPSTGARARFLARDGANTVSLRNVSHIVVDSLELEGLGRNADAVKAESDSRYAHHVTLSRLRITGHDADQAIVGISIQSPAWDWEIRDCEILGVGTGMYLGRSDGSAGLVGAVIERNVIQDTVGYNLQIKHQIRRPDAPGMPVGPRSIILRHNVFAKVAQTVAGASGRPNVLVGHFPRTGPGSDDLHVVYGNVFYENPGESLLQGEGNVALYNNVFVNGTGPAISIQPHNDRPRRIAIFNNTILARGMGLSISGVEPGFMPVVVRNAVFADRNRGWPAAGNLSLRWEDAGSHLRAPYASPPALDVSAPVPLPAKHAGLPAEWSALPDADVDLLGERHGTRPVGAFVPGGAPRPIDVTRAPVTPR